MNTKFIISLCLFLACSSIYANSLLSQTTHTNPDIEITTGTTSITKGLPATGIQILFRNTTGSTLVNGSFRMTAANHLYIHSVQTNVNCAYTISTEKNYLDVQIPSLPDGETASITFSMVAGYCFSIPAGGQISLANYLSVCDFNTSTNTCEGSNLPVLFTPANVSVSSASSFASSYELIEFVNGVRHTASTPLQANQGKTITRFYLLRNNSTSSFQGFAKFISNDLITSPFTIEKIEFYKAPSGFDKTDIFNNPGTFLSGNTGSNSYEAQLSTNIASNEFLIIKEELEVSSCIENNGIITKEISIGYNNFDACIQYTSTPNVTRLLEDASISIISRDVLNPDLCKSPDGTPKHKSITFSNSGTGIAYDFEFAVESNVNGLIPVNTIRAYIKRNGETGFSEFSIDFTPTVVDDGPDDIVVFDDLTAEQKEYLKINYNTDDSNWPHWFQVNSALFTSNYYRSNPAGFPYSTLTTIDEYFGQWPHLRSSSPVSSNCLPGADANTVIAWGGIIRFLVQNGESKAIDLNPGDEIRIEWDAYQCGLNENVPGETSLNYSNVFMYNYLKDECGNEKGWSNRGGSVERTFWEDLHNENVAGALNLSADSDMCKTTADGQIETITVKLARTNTFEWYTMWERVNPSDLGKLVFKVYLEDGLDLDKRLSIPSQLGYINDPNGTPMFGLDPTQNQPCSSGFNPATAYSADTYYAVLELKDGTEIPLTVKRLAYKDEPGGNSDRLKFMASSAGASSVKNAFYLYRLEFDLAQVFPGGIPTNNTEFQVQLNGYFANSRLKFDVRSYCPGPKPLGEDIKTYVKIHTLLEDANCPNDNDLFGGAFYTNLTPITSTQFAYQINCPGCRIPGTNVAGESLIRKNKGFKDSNRNGFPDDDDNNGIPDELPDGSPTLRKFTKGDTLTVSFNVGMSDGESGTGFTQSELDAAELYLPAMYLNLKMPGQLGMAYVPGSINTNYGTAEYLSQNGSDFIFKISSPIPNTVPWPVVQVNAEFILESVWDAPGGLYEITILAGYSTDPSQTSWSFRDVSPGGSETIQDIENMIALGQSPLLWCTNGGGLINYIPAAALVSFDHRGNYALDANSYVPNSNTDRVFHGDGCYFSYGFHVYNYIDGIQDNKFEDEARIFYNRNVPVRLRTSIPEGMKVHQVIIQNDIQQRSIAEGVDYHINERYVINQDQLANFAPSVRQANHSSILEETDANGIRYISFDLYFKHELEQDASAQYINHPYGFKLRDIRLLNALPDAFLFKDEISNLHVYLQLIADASCPPTDSVYAFPDEHTYTNVPTYTTAPYIYQDATNNADVQIDYRRFINNPSLRLNLGNDLQYWILQHWGSLPLKMKRPDPILEAYSNDNNTDITVNGNTLTLRVKIQETNPLPYESTHATYPFFVVDGTALALDKGLQFKAIKVNGTEFINYPIVEKEINNERKYIIPFNGVRDIWMYHDYNQASSIAFRKRDEQVYELEFEYTCSNINDNGCSGNPTARGMGSLNVTPGYDCYDYPGLHDINDNGAVDACGIFNPVNYNIYTLPYGGRTQAVILDSEGLEITDGKVKSCSTYTYQVEVTSCQAGNIDSLDIIFNSIPAGITISGVSSPDYIISQNPDATNTFHVSLTNPVNFEDESVPVNFNFEILCAFEGGVISSVVTPVVDCGGSLSPVTHTPINSTDITLEDYNLDPITFVDLTIQGTDLIVSYNAASATTGNNSLRISLPSTLSFANGGGQEMIIPIDIGTAGTVTVTEPLSGPMDSQTTITADIIQSVLVTCSTESCTKENIISTSYTYNCSQPDAGPDNTVCAGSPVTIGTVAEPGKFYSWSSVPAGFSSSEAMPTVNPTVTTNYYLTVSDETGCSSTDMVTISVHPLPSVSLRTTDPEGSSILCDANTTVEFTATAASTAGITSYTWYSYDLNFTNRQVIAGATSSAYSTSQPGWYEVVVEDNNGCTNLARAKVINELESTCDGLVCPGEAPRVHITNLGGVIGQYGIQWQKDGTNELLTSVPSSPGWYTGYVITQACTLATSPCEVVFKPVPNAYTLSPSDPIFMLPGEEQAISITNPDANPDGTVTVGWSTGITTITDILASHPGTYTFTATLIESGCSISSSMEILMPGLYLSTEGGGGSGCGGSVFVNLRTNGFTLDNASDITWFHIDPVTRIRTEITDQSRLSNQNARLFVDQSAYYEAVYSGFNGVTISRMLYVDVSSTPVGPDEILSDIEGRFEAIDQCSDFRSTVTSDYDCLETDFLTQNPRDYTMLIGKQMINTAPTRPEDWNRNLWTGTSLEGDAFMLVDGQPVFGGTEVWSKTVTVAPGDKFIFKGSVQNIDAGTFYQRNELPEVFLLVSYINPDNNERITLRHDIRTIFRTNLRQWIDLTTHADINLAFPDISTSFDPTGFTQMEVSLRMQGGGAIGRDIGVDGIRLIQYNNCTDFSALSNLFERKALALSYVEVPEQFTCYGIPVTLRAKDLLQEPGMIYEWQDLQGNVVTDLQNDNDPFTLTVNPTSTTEYVFVAKPTGSQDLVKHRVKVNIIEPYINITADNTNLCASKNVNVNANKFSGVSGVNYQWLVNGVEDQLTANGSINFNTLKDGDVIQCSLLSGCKTVNNDPLEVLSNEIIVRGADAIADAGEDKEICISDTVQIGSANSNGVSYSWYPTLLLDNPSSPTPMVWPTKSSYYILTVTDVSACTTKDSVFITLKEIPMVEASEDTSVCSGEPVQLTVTGADTYIWSPSDYLSDPGISNPISNPEETTTYIVKGSLANGCSGKDQVIVNVYNTEVPVISYNGDLIANLASGANAVSFAWYKNGVFLETTSTGILTSPGTGEYTVKVKFVYADGNTCSEQSMPYNHVVTSDKATLLREWRIFPVPASEYLQLELGFPDPDLLAEIVNVHGVVVGKQVIKASTTKIDLENMIEGVYIIQLKGNDKIIGHQKFIIVK